MDRLTEFISKIRTVPVVSNAIDDAFLSWGGDVPTSLLFSNVAKALVRDFLLVSEAELSLVFSAVEDGLNSNDEVMVAYLATGFLESLNSEASKHLQVFEQIKPHLGYRSRKYLDAWNHWGR